MQLSSYELKVIAMAASVDYRTVARLLAGGPVRPSMRYRIIKELRLRRLEHLVPGPLPLLVAS